jgi:integrase
VRTALNRYYQRIGVEEKNIHAYRHTFGTNLCRQGVPIQTASKLLGHDDISTTAKYYVNVSDEEKARAIEKLAVNLAIPC